MPSLSYDDANELDDPAIGWKFYCDFPTMNGVSVKNAQLMRAQLEHTAIDAQPSFVAGTNLHYPKDFNVPPLSLTFHEEKSYSALRYLNAWRQLVVDNAGNYGIPKDYKRDLKITLVDLNGKDAMTITYIGCWPTHPMGYTLDSDSSHLVVTMCTFSVDKVRIENGAGNSGKSPDDASGPQPSNDPSSQSGNDMWLY